MIAITFEEYLRQCPLHPNRLLRNIFNNFFSGRIIEFFASVDDIGDKEAILHLKNAVQQDDMIFILKFTELTRECSSIPLERGVECFIRARLLKYGQNGSSHELSAVIFDGNEVPDYTLSPSVFCSYFGQNVLQQFKINFDEFWHQQYIPITGIFFSIDEVHEPGDIIAKIQFRITQPYVDEVNDPVILLIRKGLQQLLNIAQKYLRKGNVEILTQPESQQENMHVMNFMEFIAIKSDAFTPAQKTPLPFILPYVDYYPGKSTQNNLERINHPSIFYPSSITDFSSRTSFNSSQSTRFPPLPPSQSRIQIQSYQQQYQSTIPQNQHLSNTNQNISQPLHRTENNTGFGQGSEKSQNTQH